ncbi:plastocyanin [Candidatus Nitrososphaera evergladensis SR1]|jgi:plastocyanin|uniref:Plastocyanin n=1 Tax=Candidatus Nitrososphaera evergladensis SR1 TaxID=1459636 RepID=A0A075MTM2_9ARCH|nr:cupredoxin family copper-binding protein [Candidatus Nitrososphaera evergladensis]AIF84540.1 plastocyanin [Candidatus Nitrososphaera evergladensis SR1]
MVWKIVILSIAIVIASFIIAGAIVAAQVLGNNIPDGIGQQQAKDSRQQGLPPAAINGTKVSIVDNSKSNSYSPNPVRVKAGDTVTWVNDDSATHTATSRDGAFDSNPLKRGEVFSHTFDKEGEYPYFCAIHPNMVGTVVVVAPSGG